MCACDFVAQYLESRNSVALQRKRHLVSIRPIFSKGRIFMRNNSNRTQLSSSNSDSNLLLMARAKIRNSLKTKCEREGDIVLSSLPNLLNATNGETESHKSQDRVDGTTERKQASVLYNIQWDFPAIEKRSWSHIAKFALDLPSHEEERPTSSPPSLRKCRMWISAMCANCCSFNVFCDVH